MFSVCCIVQAKALLVKAEAQARADLNTQEQLVRVSEQPSPQDPL